MVRRVAAILALIAFALCLVMGMMAENAFSSVVWTALKAMAVTFIVGLIVGAMAQRMLEENLSAVAKKTDLDQSKSPPADR